MRRCQTVACAAAISVFQGCCRDESVYGSKCVMNDEIGLNCGDEDSALPHQYACSKHCSAFFSTSSGYYRDCQACTSETIYSSNCTQDFWKKWQCPGYVFNRSSIPSTSATIFNCTKEICGTIAVDDSAYNCCSQSTVYGINCVEESGSSGKFSCDSVTSSIPAGTWKQCTSTTCGTNTTITDCFGGPVSNSCVSETTYNSACIPSSAVPGTFDCAGTVSLTPDAFLSMTCTRRPCGDAGLFYDCQ